MWGSMPDTAWNYGTDQNATANFAHEEMKNYLYFLISKSFKLMNGV